MVKPWPHWSLLQSLLRQELQQRYLGSFSGAAWALFSPLLLLAVYAFVFERIFQARVPEAGPVGFVGFLAVAFWPWAAFSEALQRACTCLPDNAALIGKVAVPLELLIAARVLAAFVLHGIGFLFVLLALRLLGVPLTLSGLPLAAVAFALLLGFALGLGLALAAIQVFVRDMAPLLAQLLTLWFFATPIIYSITLVPEDWQALFAVNPMFHYVQAFRAALIDAAGPNFASLLTITTSAFVAVLLGRWVLARCRRHIEDFL